MHAPYNSSELIFQPFPGYNSFIIYHKSIEKSPWGAGHPSALLRSPKPRPAWMAATSGLPWEGPHISGVDCHNQATHQSPPLSLLTTIPLCLCCSLPPYLYVLSSYPSQLILLRKKSFESLWQRRKSYCMSFSFLLLSPTSFTFFYNWKLQVWLWSLFILKSLIQRCTDRNKFNLTIILHF